MNARILIVEDETKVAKILSQFLTAQGYQCHTLDRGDGVIDWLEQSGADLLLLDLMLPGMDGMEVCREIRKTSTIPIIMITARAEEIDQLLGLELGADDYIVKPFSLKNVAARITANLRRVQFANISSDLNKDEVILPEGRNELIFRGHTIELTYTQYRLMETLLSKPGRIYSRSQLLDLIHDDQKDVTERTIDTHIKAIRKKLAEIDPERTFIHSVYSMGYKWEMI